jgi:hypothetical protein
MRKNATKSSPVEQPLVDETTLELYEVLQPIIHRGIELTIGSKVSLTDRQAERLRESGHIA